MTATCPHTQALALLLAALSPTAAIAQLQVLADKQPQAIFSGEARAVRLLLRNTGASPAEAELRSRVYQASSATAAPVTEAPWKKIQVLPSQTVLESAALTFPDVKAGTRFLVQWLEGTNKVVGTTEVMVYPPDLLKELKPLVGEEPLGVFDPQNQLKPVLKAAGVECKNLEDTGLEDYHGKLAIIGPFRSKAQMRESLANRSVKALAEKGVAVVWIQPPPQKHNDLRHSFYTVPEGKGTVVVVQAKMVTGLLDNPQAQQHLIAFCNMALAPEPLRLPNSSDNDTQP